MNGKKQNGNNRVTSDYFIGLDCGTDSIGWAATDPDYHVLRYRGNAMWGIRLFEEAVTAQDRRGFRLSRHRLQRRKQRLAILESLFTNEIAAKDPTFFARMRESFLHEEDRSTGIGPYSLFNDPGFTDKHFAQRYPTVYHLRAELLDSVKPHDVRLVYLALHHILKSRGHFLFDTGEMDAVPRAADLFAELRQFSASEYDLAFEPKDAEAVLGAMSDAAMTVTGKKKQIRANMSLGKSEFVDGAALCDLLAGAKVSLSKLFLDDALKDADVASLSLNSDLEADLDKLEDALGDRLELILQAKGVFDAARLTAILRGESYISKAKVAQYDRNGADLRRLKAWVRANAPEAYRAVFKEKQDKLDNYAAYSGYRTRSGDHTCKQADFCAYLKKTLPGLENDPAMADIRTAIKEGTFLTKLRSSDNGLIPNQLHRMELVRILDNAQNYLPFLNEADADGVTVRDKIVATFDLRIPYYVGPLNRSSPRAWVVRGDEKILPWNFERVVDLHSSAEAFMENLIGRCTYTGDPALPKDSLLYGEFALLNELNPLRVNGEPLPVPVKQKLIRDLFVDSQKKVTKKRIKTYLLSEGAISADDVISGIDDNVKSKLTGYHSMRQIIEKTGSTELAEEIIRRVLIFGDDKRLLRAWLRQNAPALDDRDVSYVCRLKFKDWGRLSARFLTGIYDVDRETGEAVSVLEMLRRTNLTLMQLLTDDYTYAAQADARMRENAQSDSLDQALDALYLSPSTRRCVRQTLAIVDELVDARKSAPKKIFIEVARADGEKNKRTVSRKDRLLALYKTCKNEYADLYEQLEALPEDRLRSDRLFLYYSQFGRCMYSGDAIDLASLMDNSKYDIDHIFPQSRVQDDSLNNRVLVRAELNRSKSNIYPIGADVRQKQYAFWKLLRDRDMISEVKFARLTRATPLTEEELSAFVNRQLVETQQSTKALAKLLREAYPDTEIVYSKAENVTRFRQGFSLPKCREVNDLHHAKDAYLNIVVGNVYHTKFTKKFFLNIQKETYSLNQVFAFDVPGAWKKDETLQTVKAQMAKNNILFTRMAFEQRGGFFDQQIMPAGKGQLPIRQGLDINRYGGYNKVAGAYFCVVEHTEKGKRKRSIKPVYIYAKSLYERDPIAYCAEVLDLTEPRVILPKLLTGALVSVDGKRLFITGRQNNSLLCKHAYQLAVDDLTAQYVKTVGKFVDRRGQDPHAVPTVFDLVTAEKNLALYDFFLRKFDAPVYRELLKTVAGYVRDGRDAFIAMEPVAQCKTLLEILKAFKCDRQLCDFSELCGKGRVGALLINADIQGNKSFYLIDQSVTGLYEYRRDLLA